MEGVGERTTSEGPSPFAAWRLEGTHLLYFLFPDCRQKDLERVPLPPKWTPFQVIWGRGMRNRHCFLSQPPYLPPVPSGARLYKTFTHLWLTLELFRANKPLKEEETLPGSWCEYLNAKLQVCARWQTQVDYFYSHFNPKRRAGEVKPVSNHMLKLAPIRSLD